MINIYIQQFKLINLFIHFFIPTLFQYGFLFYFYNSYESDHLLIGGLENKLIQSLNKGL